MNETMQNQTTDHSAKKWMWIAVGIVIIGLLIWWFSAPALEQMYQTQSPADSAAEDSTANIEQQLNAETDFGAVEEELKSIEADINSL